MKKLIPFVLCLLFALLVDVEAKPAGNDILKNAAKVLAVTYDYTQPDEGELVIVGKRMHKGVFEVSQPLTKAQRAKLTKALTQARELVPPAKCFDPHHGFVFYDKEDNIIGHLSICLKCATSEASAQLKVGRLFDWKGLEAILREVKMPVLKGNKAYTEAYKKRRVN